MDKRAAVRVPVRVPALCRSRGLVIDGFIEDLSQTGLFLRSPEMMAAGSSAEIELERPGEPPLCIAAQVVRVEHSPQRAGMGLKIVVDDQDRRSLANLMMRQHQTRR